MTDPLPWSINLGRWSGTQVRVHLLFVLYAASSLLSALFASGGSVAATAAWLAMLFAAVVLHELGHGLTAYRLGAEEDEVRLWPLGNLAGPVPLSSYQAGETLFVSAAGLLTSFSAALVCGVVLRFYGADMVLNPFGNSAGTGAPVIGGKLATTFSAFWWVGWFGYLNWVVFVANLIPALPLDGGRIFRAALAGPLGQPKDSPAGPLMARACAGILLLAGLYRIFLVKDGSSGGLTLLGLALLFEMMVRFESRLMEDGGLFEEGIFGYDFSEGYTSLEGSAQKVRPYRESALKRWRRRRSDARRQRRRAREAAEERRMDEILDKIHREGRSALSDDEQRFLVRVSAKFKNRPKARD